MPRLAKGERLLEPKACPQCGVTFQPRKSLTKHCSKTCSDESQRFHLTPADIADQKRRTKLRLDFNMTVDDYEELLVAQGGGCAICGGVDATRRLNVDHDHKCCPGRGSCGECVRGLLCINCNLTLGTAKDSPATLRSALRYLAEYGVA